MRSGAWPRLTLWDLPTDPDFRALDDQTRELWIATLGAGSKTLSQFSEAKRAFWLQTVAAQLPILSLRQRIWRTLRVVAARFWYRDSHAARQDREDQDGFRDFLLLCIRLTKAGAFPSEILPPGFFPRTMLNGNPNRESERVH